jgi:hypothetical protein
MEFLEGMRRRLLREFDRRPLPACPRCASRETVRIVLGQPRPDLPIRGPVRPPLRGRPSLGMDQVDRVCKRCGHQWRSSGRI